MPYKFLRDSGIRPRLGKVCCCYEKLDLSPSTIVYDVCHLHGVRMHWIILPPYSHGITIFSIRVTSLDDVDTVYSWIQKLQIEPDAWIGIPIADRPNVVASGNIVFSAHPSFSDGFKWNGWYRWSLLKRMPHLLLIDYTRKSLERKAGRTLWVVSGLQNEAMKRYSMTDRTSVG